MRHFKLNLFNKNYKYISESESSENLLSTVENNHLEILPNNKNQLVKKDSIEFSDFEQAIILDNDFANFDEHVFIEDISDISDIKNEVKTMGYNNDSPIFGLVLVSAILLQVKGVVL